MREMQEKEMGGNMGGIIWDYMLTMVFIMRTNKERMKQKTQKERERGIINLKKRETGRGGVNRRRTRIESEREGEKENKVEVQGIGEEEEVKEEKMYGKLHEFNLPEIMQLK